MIDGKKKWHARPESAAVPERGPGFGPPELTDNEVAWVEFLRMICNGRDIGPTLRGVRLLKRLCDPP